MAALDDGWDSLQHAVLDGRSRWRVDPERVALFRESTGGLIAPLTAMLAKEHGLSLRGQVLVNPFTDLTSAGFEVPSIRKANGQPTL